MISIIEIEQLDLPALSVYRHLNENQLKHYYEPDYGIFIAESPHVIERALDAGYEPVSALLESKYLATECAAILEKLKERKNEVPVYTSTLEVLSGITGYHLTRGILCAMRRRPLPKVSEICGRASRIVVLENIENPTNVGAILRSAAALDMDAVLLTSSSADPLYRRAIRVSVGTVFQIPWTYIGAARRRGTWMKNQKTAYEAASGEADYPGWPKSGMEELRALGFKTAALALKEESLRIDDPILNKEEKLALVLGNEGDGLSHETLARCDYTVKIPMGHGVDSLNVAAAGAVAFWQLGNRGRRGR